MTNSRQLFQAQMMLNLNSFPLRLMDSAKVTRSMLHMELWMHRQARCVEPKAANLTRFPESRKYCNIGYFSIGTIRFKNGERTYGECAIVLLFLRRITSINCWKVGLNVYRKGQRNLQTQAKYHKFILYNFHKNLMIADHAVVEDFMLRFYKHEYCAHSVLLNAQWASWTIKHDIVLVCVIYLRCTHSIVISTETMTMTALRQMVEVAANAAVLEHRALSQNTHNQLYSTG